MSWLYLDTCKGPQQDGTGNEYCPMNLATGFDCEYCRCERELSEERWGDCERDEVSDES